MNIDGFKLYLLQSGLSSYVVRAYPQLVKIISNSITDITNETQVTSFFAGISSKMGLAGMNKYVRALKSYYHFIGFDCPKSVKLVKEEPSPRILLTDDEVEAIIAIKPPPNLWGVYFQILAYTGARPHEILELKQSSIMLDEKMAYISHTKTKTSRKIALPQIVVDSLTEYLPKLKTDGLFISKHTGRPLTNAGANKDFRMRLKKCGIVKPAKVYGFRHSYITKNVKTSPLFHVQAQVGHKNANTTQTYVHPDDDDLRAVADNDPRLTKHLSSKKAYLKVVGEIKEDLKKYEGKIDIEVLQKTNGFNLVITPLLEE